MWKRFERVLRCSLCSGRLQALILQQREVQFDSAHVVAAKGRGLYDEDFATYVDAGLLSCPACGVGYPIYEGLPVMLPYETALHEEFTSKYGAQVRERGQEVKFANREPVPGERFVLGSFSTEWLSYDFDGVIWEMDYADHERRFLLELGDFAPAHPGANFLELGCGIGITTSLAQANFGVDAVGVDLSLAALRAAKRYQTNPFLHFVQGSVFYLPFEEGSFDTVYSRGVLHHTYSTEAAFTALARCCRAGGTAYLWVYGPKSVNDNALRRGLFIAERAIRKLLQGRHSGWLAAGVLPPLAVAYMIFNHARRLRDPTIQPYTFRRALHAARDRFTPEFAHRHSATEVSDWFKAAQFTDIEVVDWRVMPSADHDDYRRNTGVRGRKIGGPRPASSQADGFEGALARS